MLKFHQIIFRKFLILFLVLFLAIGVITYSWVKDLYITNTKLSLLNNIKIIALSVNNETNFDNLANEIKDKLNIRVTIISENGDVIAESHKDKSTMDNHKYRDEIIQARDEDFGFKIRTSKTIKQDLLYVVKKYTIDKKILYIRLAQELKSVTSQIITLGSQVLGIVAIFFISIFIVAYKINLQIQEETKKIVVFLKVLTKKKKDNYISSDFSEEFSLITKLLTKVSKILIKQDKQKDKYALRLKSSNDQKDDIISAISHEFKNPIAVINGYTQTLIDDENLNKDIQNKFLTKIYNNSNRLNELIDTLRLSTRLDSSHQKLALIRINLYKFIIEIVENLKHTYKSKEIKIIGLQNVEIKVDKALFNIVLANLIENAFKYSEDEVIVKLEKNSIDIIDTGIGIKKENVSKILEKFYRINDNTWDNSLGLGLYLVNNIVKLHHFKLKIKSIENEGSTFSVVF